MSQLILKVEALAGTDISEACKEMCELATKTNVNVAAKFNGVSLHCRPNGNPSSLADKFHEELNSKHPIKMAWD